MGKLACGDKIKGFDGSEWIFITYVEQDTLLVRCPVTQELHKFHPFIFGLSSLYPSLF